MADNTKTVVLVAFHNVKALGARYLESALIRGGYSVRTIFCKDFNSVRPRPMTGREAELIRAEAEKVNPLFIGLSVMSSMYLDTVDTVIGAVKGLCPIVAGGAFASMFPEMLLRRGCDYVLRLDGENNITAFADKLKNGEGPKDIPSLCMLDGENAVLNPIGGLCAQIDDYGLPAVKCADPVFIENGKAVYADPQLNTLSYEVVASRGCPFTCSYCCCDGLAKMLPRGSKRVRTRSVASVIEELAEAKKVLKKLVMVRFYDEVFPNTPGWVDEFVPLYKKKVGLPFVIFGHPKTVNEETLKKLVSSGLCEVIMGIQSGSPSIRNEVFSRRETNEDILSSVERIRKSGVFWSTYDFMLQHPFETVETLKETFELVRSFSGNFELQIHGLNFLPGTPIVDMALKQGLVSGEDMEKIMWAPMGEQFGAYWKLENTPEGRAWYRLIYCVQFKGLRAKAAKLADEGARDFSAIDALYGKAVKRVKPRYLYKKARVAIKGVIGI